jgi:hypothetical protein
MRGASEGSMGRKEYGLWKILWKLTIPNVAKNFFWRACHNLLPTKDNLLRRKVVKEPYCLICENEPEIVLHALWSCPAEVDVWGNSKKSIQKYSSTGKSFICIAEDILKKVGQDNFVAFVQLAR